MPLALMAAMTAMITMAAWAPLAKTRALIKKHKAALEKNSASFPKYVQDTIALKQHIPTALPCCSCAF